MSETNGDVNVCISMYADCCHAGHIELMSKARELIKGNGKLIVIVNNDRQAVLKKGREFMPFKERLIVIQAIRYVDIVVPSIDEDRTVCNSLRKAHADHGVHIFANGGDRSNKEIPEAVVCRELGIKLVDGLGEKIQSSSWLTGIKSKD